MTNPSFNICPHYEDCQTNLKGATVNAEKNSRTHNPVKLVCLLGMW